MENEFNLKVRKVPREKIEQGRTDIVRFDHFRHYASVADLQYFRDEELKQLFVKVFWEKPDNVLEVLDEAVAQYSKSKFRINQVRDAVLQQYVRDGKLII